MAGNFHLDPDACSSGFDASDSEDEPILTFTQKCRALPPKRIPKKNKVLDEENESQFKRAPLKEKDDKKKKAVRQPEKTKRSPVKKKFGVSPNPKRVKKVKKKMIEAAQKKNADVGDENGGGADGNENDENTNPNDGSRPNTFLRDSLHCFEVVEVVEDAGEALYGFPAWNGNDEHDGAVMPAEIDAHDDPLVDALLGPLLEDDGVAAQPVGTTGTMAPAAHGGVAQPARAQLPRAPPLAAQAAPAAPSERAQDHSDSDEVQTRARPPQARDPQRSSDDSDDSTMSSLPQPERDQQRRSDDDCGFANAVDFEAANDLADLHGQSGSTTAAPAKPADAQSAPSDGDDEPNDDGAAIALEGLGLPGLRDEMGSSLLVTFAKGVTTFNNWWRAERGVLRARLDAGRTLIEESVTLRAERGDDDAHAGDAQGSAHDDTPDDDANEFENSGLFPLFLKRMPDSTKFGSGFDAFCSVDANDKAIMLERFVERARKVRSGQGFQRYCPNSMRVLLNSINGAFNARARIKKQKHPETRNSRALIGFSWCNINVPEAAIFKGVRDALKDERKDFRKTGAKRGKGASTATSAINVIQLKRIREAYVDWGLRLKREGAKAELLPGIAPKKTGVNAYGRILETEIALAAIDMGTYGGGRAVSDYSLYRVRDIIMVSNGYWVFSGDWRKTDRINSNGKYVGRGPFFVPDIDGSLARMALIISARDGIDGFDKKGVPLVDRLFLRPAKGAVEGGTCIWRREVVGFGAWDPIAEVASWCEENEGWSGLRRTLGSLRYMLETGLIRAAVPMRIASGFIGHEVNGYDEKCSDHRIADYTYALGNTMLDIDRVLLIIASGFTIKWSESDKLVDPDVVEMMIDECPEEITPHMFDEETREQNAVLRSGFVARAVENPFMRKSAAGPPRREPPRREHGDDDVSAARRAPAPPRREDDYGRAEVFASSYVKHDLYGSTYCVAPPARDPRKKPPPRKPHFEQRAGPPFARALYDEDKNRALYDADGSFVCWSDEVPTRARAPPARDPPRRSDDYGGAEVFDSSYGRHDDHGSFAPPAARPPAESLALRMYRARAAYAELAERRARDRARGGAGYHGNDEHDGDNEDELFVPPTQAE